jgi:hypothetical protein
MRGPQRASQTYSARRARLPSLVVTAFSLPFHGFNVRLKATFHLRSLPSP